MNIGIFDSGFGGLSVLHEAMHHIKDANWLFYADLDNVPYGKKSTDEIIEYSVKNTAFLIERGAEAVLVACNTATAAAINVLRSKFDIPMIGMEPAVKPAVEEKAEGSRIMVIATPVTIRENKLATLLKRVDTDHRVDLLPMPGLVDLAERQIYEGSEVEDYLKEQFAPFDLDRYSALVLGCTHFNYFKPSYLHYFDSDVHIIDGNTGTIMHLADVCGLATCEDDREISFESVRQMQDEFKVDYYISSRPVTDGAMLERIRKAHNRLEDIRKL
ncbi:glutamate racemase [Butyrivibrio sp. MC2013]|uniref:glutamate racemase n=1 Tax=Butyrivibrio sp. MC2013 TaxID=1280686 RepID=UPI0004281E86|nr:glutamate racemase [Butyrivibrio sp. MC2013]